MLADVGLVGLPSVGKSTLLSMITNANPKIAAYHFTTLSPNLGVVTTKDNSFVIADLPGLIEGASKGKGLGHEFLKHIERCSILIHLISLNVEDNQDIVSAYKTIESELIVVDSFVMESNKTKDAKAILANLKASKNILIVVDELTDNVILATRNLNNVVLLEASEINTYDVVAADNMIITEKAVKAIEEVLV